ncbi:MAG: SpoIIIAH-like family protein [Clostridia bacterium]|nr:SpoIIIAH-like family protein [Clostridia bacterium]
MQNQLEMKQEVIKEPRTFPKIGRRSIIITCAVLLIAAAVVLNFVLFGNGDDTVDPSTPSGGEVAENNDTPVSEEDGYFSATQVSRQRARDEALEVLQSVVDNESADEATKTQALLEIAELAKAMEAEANIETLILAKGFEQCVAVINGDTCSVVVNGTELQENQISQINEIVYEQTGIKPANIRIVTK